MTNEDQDTMPTREELTTEKAELQKELRDLKHHIFTTHLVPSDLMDAKNRKKELVVMLKEVDSDIKALNDVVKQDKQDEFLKQAQADRVRDIVCSLLLRPSYHDMDITDIVNDAHAIEQRIQDSL